MGKFGQPDTKTVLFPPNRVSGVASKFSIGHAPLSVFEHAQFRWSNFDNFVSVESLINVHRRFVVWPYLETIIPSEIDILEDIRELPSQHKLGEIQIPTQTNWDSHRLNTDSYDFFDGDLKLNSSICPFDKHSASWRRY